MKNFITILAFVFLSFASLAKEVYVASDTHCFGPNSIESFCKDFTKVKFDYSIGDIFDVKWTLKKDIKEALKQQAEFTKFCNKNNIPEIIGNHDLLPQILLFYVKNGVLFTHGHYVSWSQEKIDLKEKASRDGVSKIKRAIWAAGVKAKPYGNLGDFEKKAAVVLAKKYNCKTIVFGHTHVKDLIDIQYDGIRIINVPQGVTKLDLPL
jgi:predicted phosphodiesterase